MLFNRKGPPLEFQGLVYLCVAKQKVTWLEDLLRHNNCAISPAIKYCLYKSHIICLCVRFGF